MSQTGTISLWSISAPIAAASLHSVGSGLFYTLLPLKMVANGHGANSVGLVLMALSAGFLVGCICSAWLIKSVGEVRAYSAFSAIAAVALLSLSIDPGIPLMMALLALTGFFNAGQTVIVESWLNASAPNESRGRVLTAYILATGLFYGLGQLLARGVLPEGNTIFVMAAAFYILALLPLTAIWVDEPELHAPVGVQIFKAFKTSPLGASASLLAGLTSSTFAGIGSLYLLGLGFEQAQIALLMSATVLGALFLQFPLGALSDFVDRRMMMFVLALVLIIVCTAFLFIETSTPLWILLALFSIFGALTDIFYPLGVAHANDRAEPTQFVSLSSNLLLIWSFGGTVGPLIAAAGIDRYGPSSFFWYAMTLSGAFALFTLVRRLQHARVRRRGEFIGFRPTSPEMYHWQSDNETNEKSVKGEQS